MSLEGCVVELRTSTVEDHQGEAVLVLNHPSGDTLALTGEQLSEWKDALERVIIGTPPMSTEPEEEEVMVTEAAAQAGETRRRKQSYDMDRAEVCLRSLRGCYDSCSSSADADWPRSVSSSDLRWQLRQSVEEKISTDLEARLALDEMGFSTVQVDWALLLTVQDFQQGLEYLLNAATPQGPSVSERAIPAKRQKWPRQCTPREGAS